MFPSFQKYLEKTSWIDQTYRAEILPIQRKTQCNQSINLRLISNRVIVLPQLFKLFLGVLKTLGPTLRVHAI